MTHGCAVRRFARLWPFLAAMFALLTASVASAQVTTSIRGVVRDPQNAAIPGVVVDLRQNASGLERATTTDGSGRFEFANLPAGNYDVSFGLAGFTPQRHRVDPATSAAVDLEVTLSVAPVTDAVTVRPPVPVVDDTSAGTRHAVSVTRIERMPLAVSSRGLEAVLVAFPGFSQNANGAIHPRGAHNQMTFVVDGLAISDQLTGAFANSLDVSVVQTAEVLTGNIPAEFGSKVSGVAILNSRSGLGTGRPSAGTVSASAGGFGTAQGALQWGGERGRVGYFGSIVAMRTDRFLDQVSLDNLHNAGRFARGFGRADLRLTGADAVRLNVMGGGSAFQLANLRSQQAAGQDQRQTLRDFSAWTTYQRTLDASSTLEATVGSRATSASLQSSPQDTPVTAAQDRRLATLTASGRYTKTAGAHLFRGGVDVQRFPVREQFQMAITSVAFNAPGTDAYNDALLPYDLTRGGTPFEFRDDQVGTQASAFVQSTLRFDDLSLNVGVRYDEYRFLVNGRQAQPRLGVSYRPGGRDVVLRASYNRNYQTPPNENLLLSNSEVASQLAPRSVRDALGGAYRPIRPERQDVYEAGAQVSIGGRLSLDTAVYRKVSRDQQDNSNFFDTGIIFPTTLSSIRVTGAEARVIPAPTRWVLGRAQCHHRSGRVVAAVHRRPVPRSRRRRRALVGPIPDRPRPEPWTSPHSDP